MGENTGGNDQERANHMPEGSFVLYITIVILGGKSMVGPFVLL